MDGRRRAGHEEVAKRAAAPDLADLASIQNGFLLSLSSRRREPSSTPHTPRHTLAMPPRARRPAKVRRARRETRIRASLSRGRAARSPRTPLSPSQAAAAAAPPAATGLLFDAYTEVDNPDLIGPEGE